MKKEKKNQNLDEQKIQNIKKTEKTEKK